MFPYAPGHSELGDIEVVVGDDGRLHLFHLTLPNHDVVHHAVSSDGLKWEPLPPALRTGDPGDCDDDQIWTMSVTPVDGRWQMLYTALSRADGGEVQKTGAAVSDDLISWRKTSRAAVGAADARWYETDPGEWGSVSWRDPKPVYAEGRWQAVVAAREKDGPLMRRGCAGLMVSDDFVRWEVCPPLFAPRRYWDLECPQVFRIGGEWWLTAATMEDRRQRYWRAPAFAGPWSVPTDGGILAPAGHYAGRVSHWNGSDLLWAWHQQRLSEGWMTDERRVDWARIRNPFGKALAPPLALVRRPDGRLARRSFAGWVGYRTSEPVPAVPQDATSFHGIKPDGSSWRVDAGGGMDLLASERSGRDFDLTMRLDLRAATGGIGFRLDDEGGGVFIEFAPASPDATLVKWLPERSARDGRRGYRREELQREAMSAPWPAGEGVPVRLLSVGPYVEVSVRGEVVLATFTGERLECRWGIWAESGQVAASDVKIAPMRRPES
jgi:beta-fructofuranosidase